MHTLNPLRSSLCVVGGPGVADDDLNELRVQLTDVDLDASNDLPTVLVHRGPTPPVQAIGPKVYVGIDLPEIVISPVLDAPGGLCSQCFERRRRQHSTDPRVHRGAVDLFRSRSHGFALTRTSHRIAARAVTESIRRWRDDEPAEVVLYRVAGNHLGRGRVLGHTNCPCTNPPQQSEGDQS